MANEATAYSVHGGVYLFDGADSLCSGALIILRDVLHDDDDYMMMMMMMTSDNMCEYIYDDKDDEDREDGDDGDVVCDW